ncbi:MAG TPA: dihydrodipicolinate synthase family protein [Gaiellaceae bacterium]|nr:dihydrodipicolinate synthase family protein [Gaiellaceae bacterium]
MLRGALAAAVTPLRDGGAALDDDAFAPYVDFLAAPGRLDGMLALGTTGEGILLSVDERKRAAELFLGAASGRLQVAVHCGAQTTADTVALAAHAAQIGADAVAVIGPPYFAYDEEALYRHFAAAAEASGPLPFYLYEFKGRAGYSIPLSVVERLGDRLAGMKVSNQPFDAVEPYLLEGLDVFIGAESLVDAGLKRGAAGSVSALAAAFPEGAPPSRREFLERFPFQAALKTVIALRGVPVREEVRGPLRGLTPDERAEIEQWLESS